jgi:hypothetical protein
MKIFCQKGKIALSLQNKSYQRKENKAMALKIKTREEAIAVLRDMVKRKKEWETEAQKDFIKSRQEATNCYAGL